MEPERSIEKLLRRYAESRRRQSASVESLHPAGREVLLREVRRQFSRRQQAGRLLVWWPRLAWAVGCLLVFGLAAAVWLPQAFVERDPAKDRAEGLRATQSLIQLKRPTMPALVTDTNVAAVEVAGGAVVPAGADPAAGLPASVDFAAAEPLEIAAAPMTAPPPQTRSAETTVMVAAPSANAEVVIQQFAQVPLDAITRVQPSSDQALAQPVLTAFRLEQQGNELRVVDRDGSVYRGSLEVAASASSPAALERRRTSSLGTTRSAANVGTVAPSAPGQAPEQQYLFKVVGTNRSLNQKVVFTGNLIENTAGLATSNQATQVRQQVPVQMLLNNVRISGKAQVGSQEIPIHAVPSP